MSRYLEITAVQRPFAFDVDENDRTLYSVNFTARAAAPVNEFEEEVLKRLNSLGLATGGVDTFIGRSPVIPAGDGPYISIIDTGGSFTDRAHGGEAYESLSMQIVIRALDSEVGRTRALAIWRALDGVYNTAITA